jgi:hypothetical protein
MMPPRVRKLALVVHIVCSVGWIGAIAASLAPGYRRARLDRR